MICVVTWMSLVTTHSYPLRPAMMRHTCEAAEQSCSLAMREVGLSAHSLWTQSMAALHDLQAYFRV